VQEVCLSLRTKEETLWLAKLARSLHEATENGSSESISAGMRNQETQLPQPNNPRFHAGSAGISNQEAAGTLLSGLPIIVQ
jgi:hypothetical protein